MIDRSFFIGRTLFLKGQSLLGRPRSGGYRLNCARNVTTVQLSSNEYGPSDTGAPPVVIMHGLFGSKQNWRSISKAIEAKANPKRQVICLDARNHGDSPHSLEHTYEHLASDVAKFLNESNIKKAIVLGHSMGGRAMIAMPFQPGLVERAIVVDISPVNTPQNLRGMGNVFQAMQTMKVDANLSMSEGRQQAKHHLSKGIPDAATVEFLLLNLRKEDGRGFYWGVNVNALEANFQHIVNFPTSEVQTLVYDGPVLMIAGRHSDYVNENDMPKIKQIFPKAQLAWVDAGHLVQLEKPAEFVSLVVNFINV